MREVGFIFLIPFASIVGTLSINITKTLITFFHKIMGSPRFQDKYYAKLYWHFINKVSVSHQLKREKNYYIGFQLYGSNFWILLIG